MPIEAARVIGLETEFGILDAEHKSANPIVLSTEVVNSLAEFGAAADKSASNWDYSGEDPLQDARGFHLERAAAHSSQLTDSGAKYGTSAAAEMAFLPRPRPEELRLSRVANTVLANGARFYVDHAHPEYSAPEAASPRAAVLWDRAGEVIAQRAMQKLAEQGKQYVLYKNNVDGKGASYGAHENYLLSRRVDFATIVRYLTPFLATRQIFCGSGRLGIGQKSEQANAFQIAQRADYIENDVGLETTFNRPLINSRDEPHAPANYRRLHLINGDANQFDISTFLKVGTTSLVLGLLESGNIPLSLEAATLTDPVAATWQISHDLSLRVPLEMQDGTAKTAVDIQEMYLEAVRDEIEKNGNKDSETLEIIDLWQQTLDALRTDIFSLATQVEWIAKYQLLQSWQHKYGQSDLGEKLRALDLQWHDLRPEKSVVQKLRQAGRVKQLFSDAEVQWAAANPPSQTRAYVRGSLIKNFPAGVAAAGWGGIVLDIPENPQLVRIPLLDPEPKNLAEYRSWIENSSSIEEFFQLYSKQGYGA